MLLSALPGSFREVSVPEDINEWAGSKGKSPIKAVMLNEPFRAEARKGEVKHPLNGFCSVVFAGKAAEARLGGWFASQAVREAPLTMTAMLSGWTMLLSFVGMLREKPNSEIQMNGASQRMPYSIPKADPIKNHQAGLP